MTGSEKGGNDECEQPQSSPRFRTLSAPPDNVRHLRNPPTTPQNIDPFLQILHESLVKPLPKGSALTAIFDCSNSGALLGNAPSTDILAYCRSRSGRPQPL